MKVRRRLYQAARRLGDLQSLRSPRAFTRRRVRKAAAVSVFKILRKLGL